MSKRHNRAKATGSVAGPLPPAAKRVLGGFPEDHPGGVLPPYHKVAKALSEGARTSDEIQRATGLSADVVADKLHEMHMTGSAVQDGSTWKLGETVQMPVRADKVSEVQKILDRAPVVREGTFELPPGFSGAADVASSPEIMRGIVKKLMAGASGTSGYRNDKEFVDDCVQAFLACSASALQQARDGATGFDGASDELATDNARRVWAALSRARLFCVRPERFLASNLVADRFTTETLAKQKWESYSGKPVTEKDSHDLIEAYMEHGTTWPFPDPLPFDSMFICYGRRFDIAKSGLVLEGRVTQQMLEFFDHPDILLYGHLLWWEGDRKYAFTCIVPNPGPDTQARVKPMTPGFIGSYDDGEWSQPTSLDPWILNMLVKSINDHKVINQAWTQTLSQRMDRKKLGKPSKTVLPLPEPFYLVPLKDELIEPPEYRSNAPASKLVEWSHRWDVRGHEVVRVQRGKLPLSPEDAAKLKKREYKVYDGRITDADDQARLLKRGIRGPGFDEWIAVLSYWREAFVKGPVEKPYVPAARV
jgi:hypothetical protein